MNILKNTLFGLVLVVAMAVLLFWNEGRAVKTARALAEGAGIVIEVESASVDPANEGKLVHISGLAVPSGPVTDLQFGVKAEGAVRLSRMVEMYQWKETSKDVERTASDGSKTTTTVYDYEKVWSSGLIDSNQFKTASAPRNPPMPAESSDYDVDQVAIGSFQIGGNRIAYLGQRVPMPLGDADMGGVAKALGNALPVWLDANEIYAGLNRQEPQIGDLKIRYEKSVLERASIVGAQHGSRIEDYTTSNGRALFLADSGTKSAAEMFKDAIEGNKVLTWVVRLIGLFLMYVGFMMMFSLLTSTLGLIPGIGGLVRGGAGIAALGLTGVLGGLVIGIGWIFYRPLIGFAILVVGVAIAAAAGFLGRNQPVQAEAKA